MGHGMSVEKYIADLESCFSRRDFEAIREMRRKYCQAFADRRDWRGLLRFFEEAFRVVANHNTSYIEQMNKCQAALPQCREALRKGITAAATRAQGREEIQAIYFEYYFDGYEGEGNFFLCTAYSTDQTSDWGAHFAADDVLDGPDVLQLLTFDLDDEFPLLVHELGETLGHISLLVQLGEVIDELGGCSWPVGYAEHCDALVVHIAPVVKNI